MTTDVGAPAPTTPTATTLTRDDLVCPLCDYPLRGLVEPRCPECGHAFDWDELLNRENNRHPFLFESQPKRNVWSFFKTFIAGFRPKRFFTLLKPSEPIRTRRLIVYWILCVMLLPAAGIVNLFQTAYTSYQADVTLWQGMPAMWNALPASDPWKATMLSRFRSFANYMAFTKPSFQKTLWRTARRASAPLVASAFALILWPWMTFLTLMIFRYSMRLARIRPIHVLRCAVYASDAASVLLVVSILLLPADRHFVGQFSAGLTSFMLTALLFATYVSWRLGRAYNQYLRFQHAALTAIASQVIVFLTMLVLATQWFYY